MYVYVLILIFSLFPLSLKAGYIVRNGRWIDKDEVATKSVQEHYRLVLEAYEKKEWKELVHQALIVNRNFPDTPFGQEALFYLGVGYFYTKDFDLSNQFFSAYLKKQTTPKHFEEAIQYKFTIAEQFHHGAKKHLFGINNLPKWVPASEEALAIYDEVITALPHHELTAQALFGKAKLLLKDEQYSASLEAFQTLIRRFPKHPLAASSFLGIGGVYLVQSQNEYPDPEFLDLAELNLRKFKESFPREEKIQLAEEKLFEMKEHYASSLYETAKFFERAKKLEAAIIYYEKILASYPTTQIAERSQKHLKQLYAQVKKKQKVDSTKKTS